MSEYYHIDSKREPVEAPRSWWTEVPRDASITRASEAQQSRMANSKAARHLGAGMVVGSPKLGRGTR